MRFRKKVRHAQAILMVLILLSVMVVLGLAVVSVSVYDMRHSRIFLESQKARYVAEAGVAYAKALIASQSTQISTEKEPIFSQTKGTDKDLDGDGTPDARSYDVLLPGGGLAGKFAVAVRDESGKINLDAFTTTYAGVTDFPTAASSLGFASSGSPSEDLLVTEQAVPFFVSPARRISDVFTVYSRDGETSLAGNRRKILSRLSPSSLVRLFLDSGVHYSKALTWADAVDNDEAASEAQVFRRVLPVVGGSVSRIAKGGAAASFSVSLTGIERGDYYVFFFGKDGAAVGTVEISDAKGTLREFVKNGEGLSRQVSLSETLSFAVTPSADEDGYLGHIELVSLTERAGLVKRTVRGIESIRINEVYANPSMTVSAAQSEAPGGTWVWNGSSFQSAPKGKKGTWKFTVPRSGYYYVKVYSSDIGGFVGDVTVGNMKIESAYHGSWTQAPVFVNGTLSVSIVNDSVGASSAFSGIELSQEPDGEFVELVNISDHAVDLSGFTLDARRDGAGVLGWPARIPAGTVIPSMGYTVLAVDANDAGGPEHVKNNGLSFISVWGESAVQLQFANNVYGSDDIVPDAGALILRDGSGNTVDAVEYDASVAAPFQSIERGDPSADTDDDNDGYFDGWFASSAIEKATPGRMNRNVGSQIIDEKTLEVRYHDISEQKIVSPAGKSIAAITGIPSSFSWQRCTLRDAAFLADKVTESETLLSLSEAWEEGSMGRSGTGFQTDAAGQVGSWLFSGVAPGSYEFALVCGAASSAGVTATITEAGGKRQLVSLLPQNGLLYLGSVTVGESGTLGLKLVNESGGGAELQRAVLYPAEYVRGKININTAPSDVLSIFFGSLSADLIAGRPYGEQDTRMLGVGDLLSGSAAAKFSEAYDRASKILTVRSNAYGVRVRGEAVGGHKATHEISTVIEK